VSASTRVLMQPKSLSTLSMEQQHPSTPEVDSVKPAAAKTETSTLSSGVKVIAATNGGTAPAIGLCLGLGSRNETSPAHYGSALLMKHLAFTHTTDRSALRIARDLEDEGAYGGAVAGREQVMYTVSFPPAALGVAVEAVGESVLSRELEDWDLNEAKEVASRELAQYSSSPLMVLNELVHEAAYGEDSALGHSFFSLGKGVSAESLSAFAASGVVGSNLTLVGVNVPLADLVNCAESALGGAPTGKPDVVAPAQWVGGSSRLAVEGMPTHLALAAQAPKDPAVVAVLKAVLDNKMKAAGLGGAFASVYSDSGLIGVQAVSSPGEAGQAVDALKATLQGLASVDAGEVKAAQVAAKVGLLSALDSTSASLQMLVSPSLSDVAKIDAVTAESLKAAASGIAGSKLALAAVGDVSSVPRM